MSLDGFIAAPGHGWIGAVVASSPTSWRRTSSAEIAAATGAMLDRPADLPTSADRMEAEEPGSVDYPFSGPVFVLTHRPPEPPEPDVTYPQR